jgi:uncharacterized Zn finger protein
MEDLVTIFNKKRPKLTGMVCSDGVWDYEDDFPELEELKEEEELDND